VSVPQPAPKPVRCVVPRLVGKTLVAARRALLAAHCTTGSVTRVYSVKGKNKVVAQRPKAGTRLSRGAKVKVTVSRGRPRG